MSRGARRRRVCRECGCPDGRGGLQVSGSLKALRFTVLRSDRIVLPPPERSPIPRMPIWLEDLLERATTVRAAWGALRTCRARGRLAAPV